MSGIVGNSPASTARAPIVATVAPLERQENQSGRSNLPVSTINFLRSGLEITDDQLENTSVESINGVRILLNNENARIFNKSLLPTRSFEHFNSLSFDEKKKQKAWIKEMIDKSQKLLVEDESATNYTHEYPIEVGPTYIYDSNLKKGYIYTGFVGGSVIDKPDSSLIGLKVNDIEIADEKMIRKIKKAAQVYMKSDIEQANSNTIYFEEKAKAKLEITSSALYRCGYSDLAIDPCVFIPKNGSYSNAHTHTLACSARHRAPADHTIGKPNRISWELYNSYYKATHSKRHLRVTTSDAVGDDEDEDEEEDDDTDALSLIARRKKMQAEKQRRYRARKREAEKNKEKEGEKSAKRLQE